MCVRLYRFVRVGGYLCVYAGSACVFAYACMCACAYMCVNAGGLLMLVCAFLCVGRRDDVCMSVCV